MNQEVVPEGDTQTGRFCFVRLRDEVRERKPLQIPHPCFSLPPDLFLFFRSPTSSSTWSCPWLPPNLCMSTRPSLPRATPHTHHGQAERGGQCAVSLVLAAELAARAVPHTLEQKILIPRARPPPTPCPHISVQAEMNPAGQSYRSQQPFLQCPCHSPPSSPLPPRCIHSLTQQTPGMRPSAGVQR